MLKRVCCRCLTVLDEGDGDDAAVTHTFCLECLPDVYPYEVVSIEAFTPEMLDALPYGVVRLDAEHRVIAYSQAESILARRDREDVLGRNFFREVAPCTNVEALAGWVRAAEAEGQASATRLSFVFDFPHGRQLVQLALTYDAGSASTTLTVDAVDSMERP